MYEGPSQEDIDRFNRNEGYCPECGEQIYDQAEFCPACGSHLAGNVASKPPLEREFRFKWIILVATIVLIFFFLRFIVRVL